MRVLFTILTFSLYALGFYLCPDWASNPWLLTLLPVINLLGWIEGYLTGSRRI